LSDTVTGHKAGGHNVISIVVPVLNEREGLRALDEELRKHLDPFNWRVLYVNDGSSDGSEELLDDLAHEHENTRVLHLSRNFGHMAALVAGIDHAEGDAVVMLDADLQHPPEMIPEMIRQWREGVDIVQAVRDDTEDVGFFKRVTSSVFYRAFRFMTNLDLEPNVADFRLIDRQVVLALRSLRERHRFLRGLVWWTGFKRSLMPYVAPKRRHGKTKYTPLKMGRFGLRAIVSFSSAPLRLILLAGLVLLGGVVLYTLYAFAMYLFTDQVAEGWMSTTLIMLFLNSIQFIALGVLGEYLATVYDEVKGRPIYLVRGERGRHRD